MLLNILILIGAILVPNEYVWLYSTHIILVCLYLICSRRFWMLILTFASIISVYSSEGDSEPILPFYKQQSLAFDPTLHQLYMIADEGLEDLLGRHVLVRSLSLDGHYDDYKNVEIKSLSVISPTAQTVILTRFTPASRQGTWLASHLYAQRQLAQLDIQGLEMVKADNKSSVREVIYARLESVFSPYASWRFSKALLLGDNSGWDQRDKWLVRALGLAHLFVVSGLHTGFVFVFGRLISRFFWRFMPNKWVLSGLNCWLLDAMVIIPILFFYAYLTVWGAPVVRAAIMLSLYLLAKVLFIQVSPYKIVMLALLGILLFEPRSILQPGLWLSFSLVCFLIAFGQAAKQWTRVFLLQLMLSTASMVLIWGWQESISMLSVPINLMMIPLAAFVWFPIGILACLEGLILHTAYLYGLLDSGLNWLVIMLESLAFGLPMLPFDDFLNVITKAMLLLLVIFWVWQAPLKRGWVCLFLIWCVLLLPRNSVTSVRYQVVNVANELVLKEGDSIELSSRWSRQYLSQGVIHVFDDVTSLMKPKILLVASNEALSPSALLTSDIDWVLLRKAPSTSLQAMLDGLNIKWLSILPGEALLFRQDKERISVRHLACSFSIFLFKSDTCRRVETLEFMLN